MSTGTVTQDFGGDRSWESLAEPDDPGTSAEGLDHTGTDTGEDTFWEPDTGATTAEYAITTLAACGFAALLVVILKSEPIKELVTGVIQTALGLGA